MSYELRQPGRDPVLFETEPEAIEAAKRVLAGDPDADIDVIDTATGQPTAPGASKEWREELKSQVGF